MVAHLDRTRSQSSLLSLSLSLAVTLSMCVCVCVWMLLAMLYAPGLGRYSFNLSRHADSPPDIFSVVSFWQMQCIPSRIEQPACKLPSQFHKWRKKRNCSSCVKTNIRQSLGRPSLYTQQTCTRNFAGMTFEFLLEWCVYTVIFTGTTP